MQPRNLSTKCRYYCEFSKYFCKLQSLIAHYANILCKQIENLKPFVRVYSGSTCSVQAGNEQEICSFPKVKR